MKSNASRGKDVIQMRVEINETENRKTIEKLCKVLWKESTKLTSLQFDQEKIRHKLTRLEMKTKT